MYLKKLGHESKYLKSNKLDFSNTKKYSKGVIEKVHIYKQRRLYERN